MVLKSKRFTCYLTFLLVIVLATAMIPNNSFAAARTIRVGLFDFTGMMNVDDDGNYSGYAVDCLNAMSMYTGWNYEYVESPWEDLLVMLADGKIDLLCTAQYSQEREELYDFAESPLGYEACCLYARIGDDRFYYDDFTAFQGMTVGVMTDNYLNDVFSNYAKKNGFDCTFREYHNATDTFTALDAGEVDSVLSGGMVLRKGYRVIAKVSSNPFYIIVKKGDTELLTQVNEAMQQIRIKTPYYQEELYKKYFSGDAEDATPVFTREEMEYIATVGPIKVGNQVNRLPICAQDDQGNLYGIEIDLMDRIAQMSGLTFVQEPVSDGTRAIDYLMEPGTRIFNGLSESIFSIFSPKLTLSDAMFTDFISFVGVKGSTLNTDDEMTLAIPSGFVNGEKALGKLYPQAIVIVCGSKEDCLEALLNGKVDFVLMDTYMSSALLQRPRYESLTSMDAYTEPQHLKLGVLADGDPKLLSILNKCIECIGTNTVDRLIIQYTVTSQYQLTFADYLIKYHTSFILIGILLAFLFGVLALLLFTQKRSELKIKAANNDLISAVQEANRANQAKSQFLSKMSHDMRTPMNTIVNLTRMVQNELDDPKAAAEDLHQIDTSNQFLLSLINDVLDMSRIESGKLELHPERYSFKEFLDYIHSNFDEMAKQRDITLTLSSEKNNADIMVDKVRINQVCFNLLSNSMKYTPAGGHVFLEVKNIKSEDGMQSCDIIVRDDGIGISEEFQKHMFTPFEQEGRSYKAVEGVGLGLSIVKSILDAMGANIEVHSQINVGTTFVVHLNVPLAERDSEATVDIQDSASLLKGLRILLAEDHPMNQIIACRLLSKVEATVTVADNGQKAVELFSDESAHYDVILMDIRMPVMDGLEASRTIRAMHKEDAKTIPIIAMTANTYSEDVRACLEAGMNAHVGKPIEPTVLYATIAESLREANVNTDSRGVPQLS